MGGGMEAHKNRWIEDWSTARENLEHNFRWTRRNFALVGIFGIALPVLVYKGIVREFIIKSKHVDQREDIKSRAFLLKLENCLQMLHMQDEDAGRPHRKFGFL